MKQLDLEIHNTTGLHARPARAFVDAAKRFESSIRVGHGEKQVNGKSLISLLTLGIRRGQSISVIIEGRDEDEAAEALRAVVVGGLGESHSIEEAVSRGESELPRAAEGAGMEALRVEVGQSDAREPSRHFAGAPGAPGIVVGPTYQFRHVAITVREASMGPAEEEVRLQEALLAADAELAVLRNQLPIGRSESEATIFDVHRELLRDPELLMQVQVNIESGSSAAESWQAAIEMRSRELREVPDELLAERANDVRDVGERVLRHLVGLRAPTASLPDEPFVLVAHDLRPSDAATLDPERVLGFCTAVGGRYAHTAILARALGIPAVVSAGPAVLDLPDGTNVILDGIVGTITVSSDPELLAAARLVERRVTVGRAAAQQFAADPAVTTDGTRIQVMANVGSLAEARAATSCGAEGVGLLRTEFLFLARSTPPAEEEQFAVYREMIQALDGRPALVRTLDVGGDKSLPYLPLPHEDNPFLGERGIRLWRAHADLLRTQLRAILRAADYGPLRILLPMITDVTEFRTARAMIESVRQELAVPPVEVGIMVEVPSAAVLAPVLAAEADFFSIGTNDLTQYTLAMDRTHPTLALEADGLHPAVLRLIDSTVRAARAVGKPVAVCGELGADRDAIPVLLGLGVEELSVGVPSVATVKDQIRTLDLARCRRVAAAALTCATAREVREGARRA